MKKTLFTILILAATLGTTASVFAADKDACSDENHYPLITKTDLKQAADSKSAFIVDVNSNDSYKDAHVPTAIHYGDHKKDFAKLLPADKSSLVVAYCGGPKCEAWLEAAQKACKLGYNNVQHYKDGITGWKKM
jgi:rhodanese-related sulfurtransferase